jgi:hypothetical protein
MIQMNTVILYHLKNRVSLNNSIIILTDVWNTLNYY